MTACRTVLVAALMLTLAHPAQAQVEDITPPEAEPAPPAAQPAPPAATPAPPATVPGPPMVRRTRYSRYRTAWYIGFGIGGGGGWLSDDSGYSTDSEGGPALQLKVGWVVLPWLLVGGEISAWRHDGEYFWVQYNHFDVVATLFPLYDAGLYGKAGIGAGATTLGAQEVVGGGSVDGRTEAGFDLKLGGGYEWQLMESFNLGAELAYALTVYDEGRTHDLTAHLTFTWY